ncbi:MAG: sigma-70 family RNA polymerase sigma factor [Pontiellaceae bacterium]|jgi:RNA polymerase sigma-70 factor (ECF subfamily)|nr:sigma-70 family RNA polymerase sigma factor [Pontiellaceae bacterium]
MNENRKIEPQPDDTSLVRRAQAGEIGAYEELVRRYYAGIYGLSYGMTGNREEAEDLVREIFVKAWKAMGRFYERSVFHIWIYRIALSCVMSIRNQRKHRKQGNILSLDEFDPDVKTTEVYRALSSKGAILRKISLSEFQQKLNRALLRLPIKKRAVVVMLDVQEMEYADMAQVIRGPESTVYSRWTAAHRLLQAELAELKDSRPQSPELDIAALLALKRHESPDAERVEKNILNTMRIVRETNNIPSLLIFPDTSFAWMFTKPRYGVAALFILFLGMHLMKRPEPHAPEGPFAIVRGENNELMIAVETNQVEAIPAPFYVKEPLLFSFPKK